MCFGTLVQFVNSLCIETTVSFNGVPFAVEDKHPLIEGRQDLDQTTHALLEWTSLLAFEVTFGNVRSSDNRHESRMFKRTRRILQKEAGGFP